MSDKPAVMSDGDVRVLISSISSYETVSLNLGGMDSYDVGIQFTLKSGKVIKMAFGKRFLRDQALKWLDEQMGTETLESKPCERCARKDKQEGDDPKYFRTYCNTCYVSHAYDRFEPLNTKL